MPRISYTFAQQHGHFGRILNNEHLINTPTSYGWASIGRVHLTPFPIPFTMTIDMIGYLLGGVAAGNVRIGLYRRGVTGFPDLPDGGSLVVETGSLAMPGIARVHIATIPDTQLTAGEYYGAAQGDDVTGQYRGDHQYWNDLHDNTLGLVSLGRSYDQAYGAFTDPCPVTDVRNVIGFCVRVKSVP